MTAQDKGAEEAVAVDSRRLDARVAASGKRYYWIAGRLHIAPSKLSDLRHGRLPRAETMALLARIERLLDLPPGDLSLPREVVRDDQLRQTLADLHREARHLARFCSRGGGKGCAAIDRAAAALADARREIDEAKPAPAVAEPPEAEASASGVAAADGASSTDAANAESVSTDSTKTDDTGAETAPPAGNTGAPPLADAGAAHRKAIRRVKR